MKKEVKKGKHHSRSVIRRLESDIRRERKSLEDIDQEVLELKEKLLEKRPEHFSNRDIVYAFFSSLLVGLTFIFKGALIEISLRMNLWHVFAIIMCTIGTLTAEIYFIGYSRVVNKDERHFLQFWLKRLSTLYIISMVVSLYLVYIFGVNQFIPDMIGMIKLIVVVSMPSAVGAAIPSIVKQY